MIRLFRHYVRQRLLLQMLFDFSLILLVAWAGMLAYVAPAQLVVPQAATLALCVFLINTASGFYQPRPKGTLTQSCARGILAALIALPLAYLLFKLPASHAPQTIPLVAMAGVVAVIAHRVYAAHAARRAGTRTRILIVGAGQAARLVGETLQAADPTIDVVGYYATEHEQPAVSPLEVLTARQSLASTALGLGVHEIVVALTERRGGCMPLADLLDCRVHGIVVSDISTHFEKTVGQIRLDYVNAGWLIFGDGFNQGIVRTTVKRIFDIVCATVLIFLSTPLMLVTAALIKLESAGPVLYRQQRVGFNGKPFNVVKFRSMRADAEQDGNPRWATERDDRVTRVGHVIRLVRIDELPQLFNVLAGEMSIVGPRPERPYFVDQLTTRIPYYAVRHSIKPGVTGWAQVRYHYGSSVEDCQEKLQYDLYYVKNHTLFLDLLILFETVAVVLTGKGAR